ncbi:uncharacterized protein LACBIDRAFT_306896 [Laccaria bicolor S238N-H82]|uniref:Predicted protein n=1 Tax=Laccaria bicolor (strain S238N-H82 / ATCC MYA-4686) TaxID=486041 RepID=B0DNY7_LACBS|nr:uncharacterized protein LACBIDRAFT_306896 [Laccaria bicolor S238N-H82]EDR03731.1 predicted protein [Laccaria bicolor S238N-H82]|eukprot:XP_001885584.1 predicted protein [Laccaria bicolor S238N-H82]
MWIMWGMVKYWVCVKTMNTNSKVLDDYDFGHMKVHDVAIMPDSLQVLGMRQRKEVKMLNFF